MRLLFESGSSRQHTARDTTASLSGAASLESNCSNTTVVEMAGPTHSDYRYTEESAHLESPHFRTATSAQLDLLNCEPTGGATVPPHDAGSCGAANWVADQAQSLLDPLAGHPRYTKIRDLHKGGSGFVQLAFDRKTGQYVAVKFLARNGPEFEARTIARELVNHKMCALHPHIVQLQEVFLTEHFLAIAMEYISGGDLSQLIDSRWQQGIGGISEEDARHLFRELVVAMDYCHRLGIVNRDIKLDNLMLQASADSDSAAPVLKICDFGFSKDEAGQSISKSTCGTPEYMAPEVLFEDLYDGKAADVWSCGVTLYVLLTGNFPFVRPEDGGDKSVPAMQAMFTRISRGDYMPLPHLSPECQSLIHALLRPTPQARISVQGILRHAWVAGGMPAHLAGINAHLLHLAGSGAMTGGCPQTSGELVGLVETCVRARASRFVYSRSTVHPLLTPAMPPAGNPFVTQSKMAPPDSPPGHFATVTGGDQLLWQQHMPSRNPRPQGGLCDGGGGRRVARMSI